MSRYIAHEDTANDVQFIPIPKNASTSIISAMFRLGGTVEEIHRSKPKPQEWVNKGFTFAVVRNPLARFVSTWMNKVYDPHKPETRLLKEFKDRGIYRGMPLEEFADVVAYYGPFRFDPHLQPQSSFIPLGNPTGRLLRQERLASDWEDSGLKKLYGPLPRLNESGPALGELGATPALIREIYCADYEMIKELNT